MTARVDFLLRHLGPALLLAALLLALDTTTIDSAISDRFFDPAAGVFPLRHNGLLEVLGHQWAKELIIVVAGCVIGMYFLSFLQPALAPHRRVLLFLSLALSLAPLAVTLLKVWSPRHCPWSVHEYGGFAPRLSVFDAAPPGMSPGHCFPSGHASAGFALLAFYFAGRALGNRRLARAGLWGGLAAGMAFGMVRIAQGAHFLSHNLWSALVCWLVILALYVAVMGMPKQRAVRIGGGAFFDYGRAWGGPNQNLADPGWLSDAGVGLRIVNDRSALGGVLHIDIAFPLHPAPGVKPWQFFIKVRNNF